MMTSEQKQRYSAVAIVLHWAIAIGIFSMIPLGWWMGDAARAPETQAQAVAAIQLHKSLGLSILGLSLVRLGWRLAHRAPPLPAHMPGWERFAAKAAHWGFYILMIVMPMTGWLYASTGWSAPDNRAFVVPTIYFDLFPVPHLFGLSELEDGARAATAAALEFIHSKLAWVMVTLAGLHVAAALKHHFFDQDDVLVRMAPGLRPLAPTPPAGAPEPGRRIILIAGAGLIVIASGLGLWRFASPPSPAAAIVAEAPQYSGGEFGEAAPAAPAETTPAETPSPAAQAPAAPGASAPGGAGAPPLWRVDSAASSIGFSGAHAGSPFNGRFNAWSAEIRFDPANLAQSSARVTIEMASARDGVALHEQSLPEQEWFDSANHPRALFETTRIRAIGNNRYEAAGALTIKGKRIEIALPFTLSIQGDRAVMDGRASIERAAADLGQTSDPGGDWVSTSIDVAVHVEAMRAP